MIFSTIVPIWPALARGQQTEADATGTGERARRIEQMFERHLDAVWRTARDLGIAPRDQEDVVQEVMLVCVRRLADIDPERERAFLLATAARVAANWRRTRRRRPAEPVESVEALTAESIEPQLRRHSPADALERKRELELVQSALEQMTDAQREAFTLFEIEGLTAREIAVELGLSEGVVFARVQRGRAVFQRCVARVMGGPGRRGPG